MSKSVIVATVLLLGQGSQALASAVEYHTGPFIPPYESYTLDFTALAGMVTPLSEQVGGLTFSYSSPTAAGFRVSGPSSAPVLLGAPGEHALKIEFSQQMFGYVAELQAMGEGTISVSTFNNGVPVWTRSVEHASDQDMIISLVPVCVCPNYFDSLVIAESGDQSFGLKKLHLVHSAPDSGSTVLLLAAGFLGIALVRSLGGRLPMAGRLLA